MIYTQKMQDAVHFAIKVHEVDQKQKRKGKDIAYIGHPLTVALILAHAHASEDVVIAGILHDTVEDSAEHAPVAIADIAERFGTHVARLVESVTEPERTLPMDRAQKTCARAHYNIFT